MTGRDSAAGGRLDGPEVLIDGGLTVGFGAEVARGAAAQRVAESPNRRIGGRR
ncbi:hypothetical protein Q0Z83_032440 [Actinoplanes sichuanensis]|uniref:Uncharacterized protein n=1 Tax=Actinoplanes sichuanensis TaxID=512349 RepID=A0ABW4ARX0_9ACTN|nr:hypothetical protein [Actinoplanes sichuanensis]BEL05053.1 hypothetical protein Q0Z83_032440 [Actinoplanes sichuanensis]